MPTNAARATPSEGLPASATTPVKSHEDSAPPCVVPTPAALSRTISSRMAAPDVRPRPNIRRTASANRHPVIERTVRQNDQSVISSDLERTGTVRGGGDQWRIGDQSALRTPGYWMLLATR